MTRIKQNTPNKPCWAKDLWGQPTIMDIAVNEVLARNAKSKAEGDAIIEEYKLSSGEAFAKELRKNVKARLRNERSK